jgi:thiol-disulfide isomerase/thioredoxin
MKIATLLLLAAPVIALGQKNTLPEGYWRATLQLREGVELPFTFEAKDNAFEIINDKERISVQELSFKGDTLHAKLPVFDTELVAKLDNGTLKGYWINHSKKSNNRIPFSAERGKKFRFSGAAEKPESLDGRWEATFSPGSADSSKAVGVFEQRGNYLAGTFLTPTGDYRYLEGEVQGNRAMLSCFDGSHAFLFRAELNQGVLSGTFWSGSTWSEPWTARRNESFTLPDPDSLTFLKPGYERLEFSFPSLEGGNVSLSDPKFKGKVVIVQIMGSWCPNCMDETAFLSDFYRKNSSRGIEVIGLAYERPLEPERVKANVERLKNRYKVGYTLLLAGTSSKAEAAKTLPMLNHILSFPTTVFIDRKGKVRKIHTGFSGPATGKEYEKFTREFRFFTDRLLKEKP